MVVAVKGFLRLFSLFFSEFSGVFVLVFSRRGVFSRPSRRGVACSCLRLHLRPLLVASPRFRGGEEEKGKGGSGRPDAKAKAPRGSASLSFGFSLFCSLCVFSFFPSLRVDSLPLFVSLYLFLDNTSSFLFFLSCLQVSVSVSFSQVPLFSQLCMCVFFSRGYL